MTSLVASADADKTSIMLGRCVLWLLTIAALAPALRAGTLEDANAARARGEHATALKLLRSLAERDDAAAQCALGEAHAKGQGVKRDVAAAVAWYRRAAEGGSAGCQSLLGAAYEDGRGVQQDLAAARKWYGLAAEAGDMQARHSLGRIYYEGIGIPQDYVAAAKWYELAAEQGDANAQHVLGLMYANARGVAFDAVLAHAWINLAVARYLPATPERSDAARHREQIAAKMGASQLAQAQALARDWRPGGKLVTPARGATAEARAEASPSAPTQQVPPAPVVEREEQWIYRASASGTAGDLAAFLAADYSAVLFRARCDRGSRLVLEFFGLLPLRGAPDAPAIVLNAGAGEERRLPLEMQALVRDGQEMREARLALSPTIAEALANAQRIDIDAPAETGEGWRAGLSSAIKRVTRSCR